MPFLLPVGLSCFWTAQRGACQADSLFLTVRPICTGLENLIGKNRFGVTAEFPVIILRHRSQVAALVEITSACLFQKGEAVHHRKVQFLTEFRRIRTLFPLNRANVRLLKTTDYSVSPIYTLSQVIKQTTISSILPISLLCLDYGSIKKSCRRFHSDTTCNYLCFVSTPTIDIEPEFRI